VDVRGTGGSGGRTANASEPQEARDGAETVEWAAAQPWCDGSVGVWGMSYGGGMALRVAAQRPPHLRAMISTFAGSDPYESSFPGGCLKCLGKYARESWMLALDLAPPAYQDTAGRWREVWRERLERLETSGMYAADIPRHRHRDSFWRERALDVSAISVPTMIVGAWRDLNPEAMVRVFAELDGPRRLIMGPWLHVSPDLADQEPLDWLHELSRWWDCWLRDEDDGVSSEPPVTIFVQRAGTWRAEHEWPIARTEPETLYLSAGDAAGGALGHEPGDPGTRDYVGDPRVGVRAGTWDPLGLGVGYPLDQGPDDRRSLTFTGDVLADDLEITGSPEATLFVSLLEGADETNLVAKLADVAPDGSSALITTGWLRAGHRMSHEEPEALEAGRPYEFRIRLWATSYSVPRGHRLRLSLSCGDFPHLWPTPVSPRIRVHYGDPPARLTVPGVPAAGHTLAPPAIRRPDGSENHAPWDVDGGGEWKLTEDLATGGLSVRLGGHQVLTPAAGGRFEVRHATTASVDPDRPDGARVAGEAAITMWLPAGERVEAEAKTLFFRDGFLASGRVAIDGRLLYEGTWSNL
jgi:putative CocE/NonD family hydrolase